MGPPQIVASKANVTICGVTKIMEINKAVIPAAGLGTRFLPATKASPKEMLPLLDKPLIQYSVEEAIASGIKNIILITGKGKRSIEDHFDYSFELEHFLRERGKLKILNQIKEIADLANFIFIRQKHPLGLGHAILCAKDMVTSEPFAVFLPDSVFIDAEIPCIQQLIKIYEKYRFSVVALMQVEKKEYHRYGMCKIKKIGPRVYQVLDLVEKPTKISDSPSNLAIAERYILTPKIFECLEKTPPGAGGEIQITDGIRALLKYQPVYGYEFEGKRLDAGDQLGYIKATIALALGRKDLKKDLKAYLKEILKKNV